MTDNIKDLIAKKVHFIGKSKYEIMQTSDEAELIKQIDKLIDVTAKEVAFVTGEPVTISEGDRYSLRWEVIKNILIKKGIAPERLKAIEETATAAAKEAIEERHNFVDSFKIVK